MLIVATALTEISVISGIGLYRTVESKELGHGNEEGLGRKRETQSFETFSQVLYLEILTKSIYCSRIGNVEAI
jgi:hypothetical protein